MDLILRNARLIGGEQQVNDIGVLDGRIADIRPQLAADGESIDLGGRLVSSGLIETHIHLDKSCILDRCKAEKGDLEEAIQEVARVKKAFTPEDVYARGKKTLEKCILNGTTHMRTQLEVDPGIGLRGLEGVRQLIDEYKWAIDIEICIFPQEGLLNNPGTDELMVEALKSGGRVVGAAPYTDSSPHGQIDRIFEMAREFDIDIDMHLDFAPTADSLDLLYVCEQAEKFKYGGRVAIGHVTKLSAAPPELFERCAKAHGGCRRGADRAALDRPLSDGPAPGSQRDARRRTLAQGAASRRQLLALDQQRAQSVHAVRRLLAGADGEPLRQYLSGRREGRHPRMLQHDLVALSKADEPEGLRADAWLLCRSRGAGRDNRRGSGRRARAGALCIQARTQDGVT